MKYYVTSDLMSRKKYES